MQCNLIVSIIDMTGNGRAVVEPVEPRPRKGQTTCKLKLRQDLFIKPNALVYNEVSVNVTVTLKSLRQLATSGDQMLLVDLKKEKENPNKRILINYN